MIVDGEDSLVSLAKAPGLTVNRTKGIPKIRKTTRATGFMDNTHYGVHNNNITNLEKGVKERVFNVKTQEGFAPPLRPKPGVIMRRLAHELDELKHNLPDAAPVSGAEFVSMYKGRLRTRYAKALESLLKRPLSKRDAYVSAFGKCEKTNFTLKPNAPMRIVSPRNPRYNVELGRFIKQLEKTYCNAIAKMYGDVTVFKGMNADEAGKAMHHKWGLFKDPVAIGLDASRFDQHVSIDMLKWEQLVLAHPFSGSAKKRLKRILKMQLKTKCFGRCLDGWLRYIMIGGRCSGDMNTGIGNCIIMCAMVHAYARSVGVKIQLANNGDDCVVIMEKKDETRFSANLSKWFEEMGFSMKIEKPVYVLEEIEFCQAHPVATPDGYRMVRVPSVALEKDAFAIQSFQSRSHYDKYWNVVGQGGLALCSGIPVMQSFYQYLRRGRETCKSRMSNALCFETGMMMLARGMDSKIVEIHDTTRYSFYLAFGITPDVQVAMEDLLSTHTHDFRSKFQYAYKLWLGN